MSERRKRPRHAYWKGLDNPRPKAARAVPPEESQQLGATLPAEELPTVTGYAGNADDVSPVGSDKDAYDKQVAGLTIPLGNSEPAPDEPVYWEPDLFSASAAPAAPGVEPRPVDVGRAARLTPPIQARRDIVTVLVGARFDAWYDQWMLQAKAGPRVEGEDLFDDAVKMLEPAAAGMALAALRAHLDAHQAVYDAAGMTLLVEPCVPEGDDLACMLGVFETMHEDERGRRDDGELPFVERVEQAALGLLAYRDPASPFPHEIFAPGDPFFSAIDNSSFAKDATLARVRAHPDRYALIELQVTTLFVRLALRGGAGDDTAERVIAA